MVCLPLVGGLGNQLFIRAFGYALEAAGNQVAFDRTPLDSDIAREYVLDKWNYEVPLRLPVGDRFQEPDLTYHPEFLKKYERDATLTGYWQSEKYWSPEVQKRIRQAFTLRRYPSNASLAVANKIFHSNSVSLHVRRTDNLAKTSLHGLLSGEYYAKAIDYIAARESISVIFVFSDDIDWCKKHIDDFGFPVVFVDHNAPGCTTDAEGRITKAEGRPEEDILLMSLCKHHIVARSTYSWWGAYLGRNPNKIVVAPEVWFTDPKKNLESRDIIPAAWHRI